jgi:hypothetical protein
MRLYYKKNKLGALLSADFLTKDEAYNYKIEQKYTNKISFYKFGFIVEKNIEKIKEGELYDPVKDKTYIDEVQESFATIYKLQWKFPFFKEDFTLKKVTPANCHDF